MLALCILLPVKLLLIVVAIIRLLAASFANSLERQPFLVRMSKYIIQ